MSDFDEKIEFGGCVPTHIYNKKQEKWLPINSGIDFSSHLPEAYLELMSRKEYEVLEKKIERVNDYLDDILKYNATADLRAVIGVVKDILNEEDRK